MLFKWISIRFNKRKLDKFNSVKSTWDYKLHNQNVIPFYAKDELTSKVLDDLLIMSKCGTVERLIGVLTQIHTSMCKLDTLPKIINISRDKGEVPLTKYLTTSDGYPYSITKADIELSQLLTKLSDILDRLKMNDDVMYSYYCRAIKPYITEALDFRVLVNK